MKKFLSIILVLAMTLSLCSTAFAVEYREENEIGTETDIEMAKEAYAALSPEAKAIFDAALADDQELLQFHKDYVDPNCNIEVSSIAVHSAAAAANPMTVLNAQLALINLPQAVTYSLKAMGAGMAAAIADGPLPIGDILLAAASASAVVVIAANWDAVYPKFGQITRAFQKAFSTTANNISSAFAQIKSDAKKEADKKAKEKKPTGNRVKDVVERLKKEGFKKVSQNGSHVKWKKGDKSVTVPNHGPNREIPIGTLRNIWRQAGWI
jgi:predicted RNA binding protein YcfA (HicA-like mRNA interferase family)